MANEVGRIGWVDLTVPDAGTVRDFYREVVGWESDDVDMGEYADYTMRPPGSENGVAGVCHARGTNAGIPPVWLVYLTVADVAESAERCVELGGQVLIAPKGLAGGRYCVIQDPAGAICALYEEPRD